MIFPEKAVYYGKILIGWNDFMKNNRISEKILLGACRILLEWEKTYANLDECIDQMRADQAEGRSAIASLLFE